jgi:hypothetical protein
MIEILVKNMIKITTAVFLFSTVLYGCSPKNPKLSPVIPFQCINTQTRCEIVTEFGIVSVKFNVEKVTTESPFSMLIELQENSVSSNKTDNKEVKVLGYMEGKTMFMGKIPLFFKKKEGTDKNNQFIAETMLGSCSEKLMTWRLWLTLETKSIYDKKQQTTFSVDFDASRF